MKRNILISIIVLALFSTFLSCKKEKEKEENLDKQEKREIVAAIFGAAMDGYNIGVADAKNTKSIAPFDTNISYNFSFVKTDGEDGYISIEVEGTGIYHYDDNNVFNCLGGIIRLNVAETINHYKVVLSNGRVCYIDADPAINIVMNLDLLPGCVTFDPTTSYVKIVGTFQCEGYSYDISINVKIKEDGTPSLMQGTINGASIYF
ncbi:MAG: hypothetical protein PHP31_09530 [Lentimicrobiaceae bacterium]|nr:hypothetical protein [Lentimicrobiaceae bacterium]